MTMKIKLKIGKRARIAYFIVFAFVLMEQCFYLVNKDTFKIAFLNYAMLWFFVFVGYWFLKYITYQLWDKKTKMYFASDVAGLILLTIIASIQSNLLTDQPILMGLSPQRNYIFVLLGYFVVRKLAALNRINFDLVKKGLIIVGCISIGIYLLQIALFGKVEFVHVYTNIRLKRLYVDSFLCVIVGLIGLDSYLKTGKIKYLFLLAATFVYELVISKGRLELTALAVSCACIILMIKKCSGRKMFLIFLAVFLSILFLKSSYAERFFQAISLHLFGKTTGVDTMAIRLSARSAFISQLQESYATMIFGCGYPNQAYAAAAAKIGYNKGMGLVDNGIFAFGYVYGALGVVIFVKWFVKLFKASWKLFKKYNEYLPITFMIFSTILLYNITFWWHKPSWTWAMVILMAYIEHKLYDYDRNEVYYHDIKNNI